MADAALWQKIIFRLKADAALRPHLRRLGWTFQGAEIGSGTRMPSGVTMNWPHQVRLGANCVLEEDISFKFSDSWKPGPSIVIGDRAFLGRGCEFNSTGSITVGHDALIASGCRFIDHDHDIVREGEAMNKRPNRTVPIALGNDVWLGVNVVVLKGVTIGDGAVVGAGAVVTKSIPAYEIWAGVPARKIGERPAGTPVGPPVEAVLATLGRSDVAAVAPAEKVAAVAP